MLSPFERADLLTKARAATPGNRNIDIATSEPDCGKIYAEIGEYVLQVFANTYNNHNKEKYFKHDVAFYGALYPSKVVALLEGNQLLTDMMNKRETDFKEAVKELYDEATDRSQKEEHIGERYAWGKVRMELHKLASKLNIRIS
jgi:hypothetical protein